jgi:acyl carrier protein
VTHDLETVRRALHDHIVKEILLRKAPLAPDEDLFAGGSGFDSMSLTRVLVFIEQRFGVQIPDEEVDLDEVSTVDRMARFVAGRIAAAQG